MAKKEKTNKNSKTLRAEKVEEEHRAILPARLIGPLADEIAKTVVQRLPGVLPHPRKRKSSAVKKLINALFLDTSAIIDGRIFDVIELGLLTNELIVPESILSELKHIADSQDTVKRERGRRGLERLEQVKKIKGVNVTVLTENDKNLPKGKKMETDDKLIKLAKNAKGRVITCDYNLEKKAQIDNVIAVNVNELANRLKIQAVPGESVHISIQHVGKDVTQGVGYLDDGTMIVVEQGSELLGKDIDVVIARVLQTASGRILFAKKVH